MKVYEQIYDSRISVFGVSGINSNGQKIFTKDIPYEKGLEILTKHPDGKFSSDLLKIDSLPSKVKTKIYGVRYSINNLLENYYLSFKQFLELGSPLEIKVEKSTIITSLN